MTEENTKYEVAQVTEPQSTPDAMHFMMEMASRNITPENIEKMMELKERDERRQAEKAFYDAMAKFRAMAPSPKKDKLNKQTNSYYASVPSIVKSVGPALAACDLSYQQETLSSRQQEGIMYGIKTIVFHRAGHKTEFEIWGPPDDRGIKGQVNKTPIHAMKSTYTYLRGISLEMALGIAAGYDTDDDGNGACASYLSGKRLSEIYDLIEAKIIDRNNYLAYCQGNHGVGSSFDEIPDREYQAMRADLASMPDKAVAQ